MVLGGFSPNCCIELYIVAIGAFTVLRYRLDILVPTVRRFASFQATILFQDNACSHTARLSIAYLYAFGIDVLDWPVRSPDLIPIEHVWDQIYRRSSQRQSRPLTRVNLIQVLIMKWEALPLGGPTTLIHQQPLEQYASVLITVGDTYTSAINTFFRRCGTII